jgi:hypothetical protein
VGRGLSFHLGHIDRDFKRFNKKSLANENAAMRKNAAIAGFLRADRASFAQNFS